MKLTYKFHLPFSSELRDLCKISKDLYNQTNYVVKTHFNETEKWLRYNDLNKIMRTTKNLEDEINYEKLKAQSSQQILRLVDKNWTSYFRSLKEYKKAPGKFKGLPKPPNFKKKDELNLLIFTNQDCRIRNNILFLSRTLKINIPKYEGKDFTKFNQVRIIPKHNNFECEIIYEEKVKDHGLDKEKCVGIDLGLNNLATLVGTDGAIIFSGKPLKAKNQLYNKTKAKYQSINDRSKSKTAVKYTKRMRRLDEKHEALKRDYMHKTSAKIIDYCVEYKVGNIFVGLNKDWKNSISLGNKTNQKFVSIPHSQLISMLKYKAELNGINFQTTEEAYTSKCDSLTMETLEHHENYSGKRVHRGLFVSSAGFAMNADVNGAVNIVRKVVGNSYASRIINSGLLFNPVKSPEIFTNKIKVLRNFNRIKQYE